MTAYYNEFDPKAAAWLRQLIKNGDIADGVVDERDIKEVKPEDLEGFRQCHFFAGIGVWSYALRRAGWADDRHVWTASLPCQPFSAAGKRKGKDDERHLLPHYIELVRQCKPDVQFGEQVPGAIRQGWLDDLYDEMERESYAVGATVLTAAGAGLPHIRQRLYWVADAVSDKKHEEQQKPNKAERERGADEFGGCGMDSGMANSIDKGSQGWLSGGQDSEREIINGRSGCGGTDNIDWLYYRDNKYRPIRKGIKPLVRTVKPSSKQVVNGATRGMVHSSDSIITPNDSAEARTQRLKGYGNAICEPTARVFIESFMEITK